MESPTHGDDIGPCDWDQYIGQQGVKSELMIRAQAAKEQERPMCHVLLVTQPGAGKTTLARLLADLLSDDIVELVMPVPAKIMAQTFRSHFGLVLLDELHGLSKVAQKSLLSVISDGWYQLPSGQRLDTSAITIVGATTEPQDITKPLWDRFKAHGSVPAFEDYATEELAQIAMQMGNRLDLGLDEAACAVYGNAAAGVPRHVATYITTHRDLSVAEGRQVTATEVLELLRTTSDGLTPLHKAYLERLDMLGGTKGVKILSGLLRTPTSVVEDLEVLLIEKDYVIYTPSGRELTPKGHAFIRDLQGRPVRGRRGA